MKRNIMLLMILIGAIAYGDNNPVGQYVEGDVQFTISPGMGWHGFTKEDRGGGATLIKELKYHIGSAVTPVDDNTWVLTDMYGIDMFTMTYDDEVWTIYDDENIYNVTKRPDMEGEGVFIGSGIGLEFDHDAWIIYFGMDEMGELSYDYGTWEYRSVHNWHSINLCYDNGDVMYVLSKAPDENRYSLYDMSDEMLEWELERMD